jgi:2-dehydro-3-deoxyphosphogluconate aldolase / (4S)-4-hydroxy-2-oxoglutarate aldolase
MKPEYVFTKLKELKVILVLVIDHVESALTLADALMRGGLPIAEITFRTRDAAEVIHRIRTERPEMIVGAGTVLLVEDLRQAVDAGAAFGVAPGLNRAVAAEAKRMGFPFLPGVMTPSEIDAAFSLGFRILKFFPASAAGGVPMIKSLAAPFAHLGVQFVPTGGINLSNLRSYLEVPQVVAVGGTWIASREDIARKAWPEISARCREVRQHMFTMTEKQ